MAFLRDGPNCSQLNSDKVSLHKIRSVSNYDPRILWQLLNLIRRLKPDIIHTWIVQMDILGAIAARITKIPWILREPSCAACWPDTMKFRLRAKLGSKADVIVSNSNGGNLYWAQYLPDEKRFIIPNGLPLKQIEETPASLPAGIKLKPSENLILYAGRLCPGKNLDKLIKALEVVISKIPVVAVFCGDGPLKRTLEKQVKASGLSNKVWLLGSVPSTAVWSLMKKSDLFVFMSDFEGFPNVVGEAMVCSCPLLVSDIGPHRELVDESSALLVDPNNPGKIAEAILVSLSNPQAAKQRANVGKEKTLKWSISNMADKYEKTYRQVLTQGNLR